jgi:glycerate kinase
MPRRVLIAFDKFKDSMPAQRACTVAAAEIQRLHPDWQLDVAPLTDGGEGFCPILVEAAGGTLRSVTVEGPLGSPREATFGMVEIDRLTPSARSLLGLGPEAATTSTGERLAVIEMAAASGLALVPLGQRNPWRASTYGTGQLLRAAADCGASRILLGVGGSATIDLGLGALAAIGLEFRDGSHASVRPPVPADWERIRQIEGHVLDTFPSIVIACDVTNSLLGPEGAAAVYGLQKGLRNAEVPRIDGLARHMATLVCAHFGKDFRETTSASGSGAAGGLPFGLGVAAGARMVGGFALVSAWLDLERRIESADLVVTGEGRFDRSSLSGKGPGAIVALARAYAKRTLVFAGAVEADEADSAETGEIYAITPSGTALGEALARSEEFLAAAVAGHFS